MDKKLIIMIVALIAACVFVSGCTSSNNTTAKNYTGSGYSFTYPGDWNLTKSTENATVDMVSVTKAGTLNDTKVNSSGVTTTLTTTFQIQKSATNGMTENEILNMDTMIPDNWKQLSTGNKTIDGKTVITTTYQINDTTTGKVMKQVTFKFVKNDSVYYITYMAPESTFDSEQANFDVILNSLKFQ
jgi:hypothetical protein